MIAPLLRSRNTQKWPIKLNLHHQANCREHPYNTDRNDTWTKSPLSSRVLSNTINDKILLTAKALRPDAMEKVLPNSNELWDDCRRYREVGEANICNVTLGQKLGKPYL